MGGTGGSAINGDASAGCDNAVFNGYPVASSPPSNAGGLGGGTGEEQRLAALFPTEDSEAVAVGVERAALAL